VKKKILVLLINRTLDLKYFGRTFNHIYFSILSYAVSKRPNRLFYFFAYLPSPRGGIYNIRSGNKIYRYISFKDDALQGDARTNFQEWEPESRKLFSKCAAESQVIFDVGAYSGVYSLEASSSNPNASVFAFEPNPKMYQKLLANKSINNFSKIEAIECAVGEEVGTRKLFLPYGDYTSIATLIETSNASSKMVLVRKLDEFRDKNKKVELIKIDCEGSEFQILNGAIQILNDDRPIIFLECLDSQGLLQIREFLGRFKYSIYKNGPIGISKGDERNFVWAHQDKIEMLRKFDEN